ncbi:MAG: tyrosine-type recombinase/integrase [Myxococcales bacterium]|nr:tyrosine-type recombinase/integrase [Myxococcales bacterium]MCB9755959.1 tyrosine-type recombinase/integrase [Myxococcales bacterium]
MPTLTQRAADRARPRARRYELTCATVRGFILRVLPSGRKAYYVRYRTGGRDLRERLGSTIELTFVEARRRAIARLAEVRAAEEGPPARAPLPEAASPRRQTPRLREFAARFVAQHVDVRLKPTTQLKYRQLLRTAILPTFGEQRMDEIRRAAVVRWHASMVKTPGEANNALTLLKSVYARAKEWDVLDEAFAAPTSRVKRFPDRARERFLTPDERRRLEGFLERAHEHDRGGFRWESICALRLLAHTGMRRGEVLGLTWAMVDWRHQVLRLPDSKTGRRVVPLSPQAVALLRAAAARENPSPYVVPTSTGGPIGGANLTHTWMRIRRRVGLEDVRLHDLRHSAASDAINAGVPLAVIGRILGHRKPSTTQRYAHISDDALAKGVALMGAVIERHSKGAKR